MVDGATETFVVPDTNTFLHFRDFREIPWCQEVGTTPVTVLVTRTVLREIDKRKRDTKNQRTAQRAREISIRLSKALQADPQNAGLTDGASLRALGFPNVNAALERYDLDRDEGDDYLLAEILTHMESRPTARFILYTNDVPATVRARQVGVHTQAPSESLALPIEPDPRDQEIRQLKAENERLKNTHPKIDLTVNGQHHSQPLRISIPELTRPDSVDIAKISDQERDRILRGIPVSPMFIGPREGAIRLTYQNGEGERFLRDLDEYMAAFRDYLSSANFWELVKDRTLRVDIDINNSGRGPAEDVYLELSIPNEVRTYDDEEYIVNEPPRIPEPPRGVMGVYGMDFGWLRPRPPDVDRGPYDFWVIDDLGEEKQCTYRTQRAMHGRSTELHPLWIVFPPTWQGGPLILPFTIRAANLPDAVSHNLTVLTTEQRRPS